MEPLFDMTVALEPTTSTKNSVILPELVQYPNFIWTWLEDTEHEQEASKLLMLKKLLPKTANDHTLLSSMTLTSVSHSLTEFKEHSKDDSDQQEDQLFGKLFFILQRILL